MKLLFLAISLVSFAWADSVSTYCFDTSPCTAFIIGGGFPGGVINLAAAQGTDGGGTASISIQDDFQVLITGGVGNGLFTPCFEIASTGFASASLSAEILGTSQGWSAGASTITGSQSVNTCGEAPYVFSFNLPFEVALTEQLSGFASTEYGLTGFAYASVQYEGALGSSGNVAITEELVPTPEPASSSLVLAGMVLCCVGARKRRLGQLSG